MAVMHRHLVDLHVGDEVRCRGNRLVPDIFTIGFDDLRHVSLTLVRVVARRPGRPDCRRYRTAHPLDLESRRGRCVTIATLIINDLELIAQNPLQDRKTGKLCRRRVTELQHQG